MAELSLVNLPSMSLDLTDDKSTLVQVMAWCRQATSHYLSQCWPHSLSPYGGIRPQWVKHPAFTPQAFTPLAGCNWHKCVVGRGSERVFHYKKEIKSLWHHFRELFKSVFVASYFRGLKQYTSSLLVLEIIWRFRIDDARHHINTKFIADRSHTIHEITTPRKVILEPLASF